MENFVKFDENETFIYFACTDGHLYKQKKSILKKGKEAEMVMIKEYEPFVKDLKIVSISKRRRSVQKIIAETFLPKKGTNKCIVHKNGNNADNRPDNLEYAERTGSAYKKHKGTISMIDDHGNSIEFKSINETASYIVLNKIADKAQIQVRHDIALNIKKNTDCDKLTYISYNDCNVAFTYEEREIKE